MATTPITNFSGLASGLDSSALIKALVASAATPMNKMAAQKTDFNSQSKKLTDIKSKLTALETASKALDARSESLSNKVASSDEKVLKVTASGGSSMGQFKIDVLSIARAERTYSDGFAASDVAGSFGTGTLSIKVGDADAVDIEVTDSDTLDSLVIKINASGAALSAGVIKEGSNYRLQVTGRNSGESSAIEFTEGGSLSLGLTKPENERQAASSAKVMVDGFEITSETNTVTGAVPGVSLNVVELGSATVNVDRDPEALKTKLSAFVTAYNDVMKTLNTEFSYSGVAKGGGSLNADSAMRGLQAALRTMVSSPVENSGSSHTMLASIGVTLQKDGTLFFDDAKFQKASSADYEGVAMLLGNDAGTGLMSRVQSTLHPYTRTDGTIRAKIDNLAERNRNIDKQLERMQMRLDKYEETLRQQYTQLEKTVSQLNSQGGALAGIIAGLSSSSSK